mgnify:CR=1 FL=1
MAGHPSSTFRPSSFDPLPPPPRVFTSPSFSLSTPRRPKGPLPPRRQRGAKDLSLSDSTLPHLIALFSRHAVVFSTFVRAQKVSIAVASVGLFSVDDRSPRRGRRVQCDGREGRRVAGSLRVVLDGGFRYDDVVCVSNGGVDARRMAYDRGVVCVHDGRREAPGPLPRGVASTQMAAAARVVPRVWGRHGGCDHGVALVETTKAGRFPFDSRRTQCDVPWHLLTSVRRSRRGEPAIAGLLAYAAHVVEFVGVVDACRHRISRPRRPNRWPPCRQQPGDVGGW